LGDSKRNKLGRGGIGVLAAIVFHVEQALNGWIEDSLKRES